MLSSLKVWIIETLLGGFSDVDSAIESVKQKGGKEKFEILTLTVKRLYNTIGAEDILKQHDTGQWTFEGKPVTDSDRKLLVVEATQFMETKLWKVLQADIKYQANRRMFISAKSEIDIVAGKLWLFTLDAFRTRLESLKNNSPLFNNKD